MAEVLPSYVVANLSTNETPEMLRLVAREVEFPLDEESKRAVETLSKKFDGEGTAAGLAAPQIGISKRIIVFAAPDDPNLRKWRPDLSDTMTKTIWINPSFVGVEEDGFHEDYEGCFSVEGVAGLVKRFKTIRYLARSADGESLTGTVRGYCARIIQHEIDHLDGVLFTDKATNIMSRAEYAKMREEALAKGGRE